MAGYLIPGLDALLLGNKERAEKPWRDYRQQQAQGLLGVPEQIMNANALGLAPEPGQELFGGVGDVQTQAPTGLMQDPNDFYKQMQYATGLMGTPGYEGAGQQFANTSLNQMMGQGQRQQAQDNWQAQYYQQQRQNQAQQAQAAATTARAQSVAKANQTGALFDDAEKILSPVRESMMLMDNVQTTVRSKGFSGMNITDDTILIKSLAKVMMPLENVMEGDVIALGTMTGIPAAMKSLAAKIGMGKPLEDFERQQLYDQLWQLGEQRHSQYKAKRGEFEERAVRRGFDVRDVLGAQVDIDMTNLSGAPQGPQIGPQMTPELTKSLDEQWEAENPSIFPSITAPTWWQEMMQ